MALLELQTETGIEKRTIRKILGEDFHLRKTASKWVPHAFIEVEKWTLHTLLSFAIFFFLNLRY